MKKNDYHLADGWEVNQSFSAPYKSFIPLLFVEEVRDRLHLL